MKNMNFKRKLPIPLEVKTQFPLTEAMAKIKADGTLDALAQKYNLTLAE